jgi:hypothetical protein
MNIYLICLEETDDMRRIFTILFLLLATYTFTNAQDVTGVWQGHFRSGDLPKRYFADEERYKFEVQIAQHDKSLQAVTYSYQSTFFYGKANADGTINPKTGKVLLQELKITEMRMQGGGDACVMTCFLQYSKSGEEEFLEGRYVSMNTRDSSNCGKGTVFLRRSTSSDFYKEPFLVKREKEEGSKTPKPGNSAASSAKPGGTAGTKARPPAKPGSTAGSPAKPGTVASHPPAKKSLKPHTAKPQAPAPAPKQELVTVDPGPRPELHTPDADTIVKKEKMEKIIASLPSPKVLTTRANQLVQSIIINSNEVILNIYDDGAIDNDTISVYLDKKLIVSNARLSDEPIVVKLHLDENNDYHELVMVAENEGDIPPNTSLMIVKAGDKRYEVRITSTEQKNAVVIFKYEKNQ